MTVLYGPPKVGGDILSYCTRCKMELAHVVVSMIDRRPAKVICKTCKSQHNHKKGAPASTTKSGAPRAPRQAAQKTSVRISEYWEKRIAEAKAAEVRPYSVQQSFIKGDVIQHPNFGMGLVEEVRSNGKMTVLFREDEKVLVYGMGKPVADSTG